MNWKIVRYKNLNKFMKMDCEKKRGLYLVVKWAKHTTSVCPFNIVNFYKVIIRKDINW